MNIHCNKDTLNVTNLKDLDAPNTFLLRKAVNKAVTDAIKHIEVDLSQTVFLDSKGLGALMALRKIANKRGGQVRLLSPQPGPQQILDLTRLRRLFEIVGFSSGAGGGIGNANDAQSAYRPLLNHDRAASL